MARDMVCTRCGHVGGTKTVTRGSFRIEVLLWLFFLLPGLIYSVWRLKTRHEACPTCGNADMIPADSPLGAKFVRQERPDYEPEDSRLGSRAAYLGARALGRLVSGKSTRYPPS